MARQDALSSLDEETAIVINDWAMKFLPVRFRETQSQWFGKHGISWHFSAVIHLANHPHCPCTNGFKIHTYIAVLDSCKQDWFAVSCILEEVLSVVKAIHPTVTQAKVRSDNVYFINFASQAGRAPQQLAPITVAPFLTSQP